MITLLLNVLKFTIVGVLAMIIISIGFLAIGYFIAIVTDKIDDYLERKCNK